MIEKIIRGNGKEAICLSFTGGDGMKIKTGAMDAITKFGELSGLAKLHEDGSVTLPRISIVTATSAANCGISSNHLTNAKHKGFPFLSTTLFRKWEELTGRRRCPIAPLKYTVPSIA